MASPKPQENPVSPNNQTTVRDIFALPEPGTENAPSGWKGFQEKVGKEVKGIKTAALPDLAEKMGELFDIPLPDIFLTSWKKANVLQELLEESKKDPETVMELELGEHTINSQHKPHIEVRIQNKTVKKLEFILRLVFRVKGFVLKIQDGAIKEMRTGSCDARGTLEYQGLTIAEKKLAPIQLPTLVSFASEKADEAKPVAPEKAEADKSAETDKSPQASPMTNPPEVDAAVSTQTSESNPPGSMTGPHL